MRKHCLHKRSHHAFPLSFSFFQVNIGTQQDEDKANDDSDQGGSDNDDDDDGDEAFFLDV